jgi:hypothetical protein
MGTELYRALSTSDLPVILGVVIVISIVVVIANLVADILYTRLDPRLSLRGARRRRSWTLLRWRPQRPPVTESTSA